MEAENHVEKKHRPIKKKGGVKSEIIEWAAALLIALVLGLIIKTYVFTIVTVDGHSMESTLHTGDKLYVSCFMYTPQVNDVVVFTPEAYKKSFFDKKPLVKRVIATEGQTIELKDNGDVYIDGVKKDEPYLDIFSAKMGNTEYPLTVPEGHIFAIGDNRGNSHDSRYADIGPVPVKDVMGKVIFRFWPFDQFGKIN